MSEDFPEKHEIPDVRPDPVDLRDLQYIKPLVSLPAQYPENAVDILPKYALLVKDQGPNGPCTGYALAAMINFLRWSRDWRQQFILKTKGIDKVPDASDLESISPEMLYYLARFYDSSSTGGYSDGSTPRAVMKGWQRHGVCLEQYWKRHPAKPETGWEESAADCTIGAYYRVWKKSALERQNVLDIQAAIYETGAVLVSSTINSAKWCQLLPSNCRNTSAAARRAATATAISEIKSGKFSPTFSTIPVIPDATSHPGGHAYALVGYNHEGFIILNSWGPQFGYYGFALLPYDAWYRTGQDAWVAALGVPTGFTYATKSGDALSSSDSMKISKAGQEKVAGTVARRRRFGATDPLTSSGRKVWGEAQAYHHSVIIDQRGKACNRIIGVQNGRKALKTICIERMVNAFKENSELKQIVVFAHSGLEPEHIALRRTAVLGPHFYEHGIYPLFISGQSGFMEPLGQMLLTGVQANRSVLGEQMDGALHDVMQAWTHSPGHTSESRDAQIEEVCLQLVRPLWTQFKHDTEVAAKFRGAIFDMAEYLADALSDKHMKKTKPGIHLIAHSAGAIHLGEFVRKMPTAGKTRQGLKAASCTLLAPACSLEFATKTYGRAVKRGTISTAGKNLQIHVLSDENERRDSVAEVYGKSLLYLMSRALEDRKFTPILGLANTWSDDEMVRRIEFGKQGAVEIAKWRKLAIGKIKPVVHDKPQIKVCPSGEYQNSAHDLFDNNVDLMSDLIKKISGRRTLRKIGPLKGF